jgi:hypothetical protein
LSVSLGTTSPIQQAEEAATKAAGRAASPAKGQGFQLDQEAKVAVEAHAMNTATEYYAAAWGVKDVHGNESYDLECRRDDEVKHDEVTGTTTGHLLFAAAELAGAGPRLARRYCP